MKATQYDAGILQQFADELYSRARRIVATTTTQYGAVAFILSAIGCAPLQHAIPQMPDQELLGIVGIVTLLAIAAGVNAGRAKAFQLKLQAQQILCQRQIEANTNATSAGTNKAFAANV